MPNSFQNPSQIARKRKLHMLIYVVAFAASLLGLLLYALSQSIDYFYSPSDFSQLQLSERTGNIRIGGLVKVGSVEKHQDSALTQFVLTDYTSDVKISFQGVLPDLFREGQGIVAEGMWVENSFEAKTVLAKHDENYTPPAIENMITK